MKLSLRGGRVTSAPPALSPFAASWVLFRAWVRESLSARLLAIALALAILHVVGSALAGSDPPVASPSPVSPAASSVPDVTAPSVPLDAGPPPSPPPPVPPPTTRTTDDAPVDLNAATLDDLRRLPGVGPKRAEAILAVRSRLGGRFRQIEDLLKVKGIGRATLKRLRPLVRLDSPTSSGSS